MSEVLRRYTGNALFILYILIITIDPTNTITHLKNVVFFLLLAYNAVVYKPDFKMLPAFLLVLFPVVFGYLSASVQMNPMGQEELTATFKAVAPLLLLFWVKRYDVVRLSIIPALLAAFIMLLLHVCVHLIKDMEFLLYTYSVAHNGMLNISTRSFLGFNVFGIYCNSFYCLLFSLYTFLFYLLRDKRLLYLLGTVLLSVPFVMGGTRSVILLPFVLLAAVAYVMFSKGKYMKYLGYPVLAAFLMAILVVIVLLATQKGDESNTLKYGHLLSYMELFTQHPEYILFGQGPATSFYTVGFARMTTQTEWSYIELVRNFGLGSLLILAVYVYPLWGMYRRRSNDYVKGAMAAYFIYLLIAGTNPLLLTSTGTFILLCAYSILGKYPVKAENSDY